MKIEVDNNVWVGELPKGADAFQLENAIFKLVADTKLMSYITTNVESALAALAGHNQSLAIMEKFFEGWTRNGVEVDGDMLVRLRSDMKGERFEAYGVVIEAWMAGGFLGKPLREAWEIATREVAGQTSTKRRSKKQTA